MTKQILGWMFALCEKLSYYDKPDVRKSAFEPFSNCCDKPSGPFLTSDEFSGDTKLLIFNATVIVALKKWSHASLSARAMKKYLPCLNKYSIKLQIQVKSGTEDLNPQSKRRFGSQTPVWDAMFAIVKSSCLNTRH